MLEMKILLLLWDDIHSSYHYSVFLVGADGDPDCTLLQYWARLEVRG